MTNENSNIINSKTAEEKEKKKKVVKKKIIKKQIVHNGQVDSVLNDNIVEEFKNFILNCQPEEQSFRNRKIKPVFTKEWLKTVAK